LDNENYTREERYAIPRMAFLSGMAYGVIIGAVLVLALLTVTYYMGGI
jgi:hypothetical protein